MASSSKSRSASVQSNNADTLKSLRTHRINTIIELRRVEKFLLTNGKTPPDIDEALTIAWAHYVNSNNLLAELRGLTRNYPISSALVNEAKENVVSDPLSTKSQNYAWLILTKMKEGSLIQKHAKQEASRPVMWGGRNYNQKDIAKLSQAFVGSWTCAIDQMLKQWSLPSTSKR